MKKIVCFGDSLTNGARDEFYSNYPLELSSIIRKSTSRFYACLNYGVNGETTSHMFNRAHQVLLTHRDAKYVLFLGGTNDSKVPIPAEVYSNNVEGIVCFCKELSLPLALGLIPPVYGTGLPCYSQQGSNAHIGVYNQILRDLSSRHALRLCDFSAYPAGLFCDGVHMNHEGYVRMANDWFKVLDDIL